MIMAFISISLFYNVFMLFYLFQVDWYNISGEERVQKSCHNSLIESKKNKFQLEQSTKFGRFQDIIVFAQCVVA